MIDYLYAKFGDFIEVSAVLVLLCGQTGSHVDDRYTDATTGPMVSVKIKSKFLTAFAVALLRHGNH